MICGILSKSVKSPFPTFPSRDKGTIIFSTYFLYAPLYRFWLHNTSQLVYDEFLNRDMDSQYNPVEYHCNIILVRQYYLLCRAHGYYEIPYLCAIMVLWRKHDALLLTSTALLQEYSTVLWTWKVYYHH